MATNEQLLQALQAVIDPNTGKDFVSTKQLRNLSVEGGNVSFDVELGYPAKSQIPALRQALLEAQYELRERGDFPVIIMLNGFDGAGRSETMNLLSSWLDPRLIQIHTRTSAFADEDDDNRGRPWLWRYWRALPPKGRIGILFGSWYTAPIIDRVFRRTGKAEQVQAIEEINHFERMLADGGAEALERQPHAAGVLAADGEVQRLAREDEVTHRGPPAFAPHRGRRGARRRVAPGSPDGA